MWGFILFDWVISVALCEISKDCEKSRVGSAIQVSTMHKPRSIAQIIINASLPNLLQDFEIINLTRHTPDRPNIFRGYADKDFMPRIGIKSMTSANMLSDLSALQQLW